MGKGTRSGLRSSLTNWYAGETAAEARRLQQHYVGDSAAARVLRATHNRNEQDAKFVKLVRQKFGDWQSPSAVHKPVTCKMLTRFD